MRKEVFYSLAALSLAPVAANAAEGTVIPDLVSGNNWNTGGQDKNNTDGIVNWFSGKSSFTINKKLVPGNYTFKAQLKNLGAGVKVSINGTTKVLSTSDANVNDGWQLIDIEFALTEEVQNLMVEIQAITDFEEGDPNAYFLSFPNEEGQPEAYGLVFDRSNFQNYDEVKKEWTTWKEPLAGINEAIDNYVDRTLDYDSDKAKKVMTAEKEKIQKETTADKLTYDFYMENQLYDKTLETNPLYIEATQIFNEATRIEAQYQADKIRKQVQNFLDNNTEKDKDGNLTDNVDPIAQEMAQKVLDQLDAYEADADAKTGSSQNEDGTFTLGADTPVTLTPGEFDVDPTLSPLKDIQADANSLTTNGDKANALVGYLQVSYKAIADRDADLEDMFGPNDDKEGDAKQTMAKTHASQAAQYLAAAKQITAYYKARIAELEADVMAKDINQLTAEFVNGIKGNLETMNAQVAEGATYIKPYYDLYKAYKEALSTASAGTKAQLDEDAHDRFSKNTELWNKYKAMSKKFDDITGAAQGAIKLEPTPALKTEKNAAGQDVEVGITLLKKDGTDNKNYKGIKILNGDITATAAPAADADAFMKDFNAFVEGLNDLDDAYAEFEVEDKKVDESYKNHPNESGYDNREYYKSVFNNQYWELKVVEGKNTYPDKTFTTDPTKPFDAATNAYKFGAFLDMLTNQLTGLWGSFTVKDNKEVYVNVADASLYKYLTADKYLKATLADFLTTLRFKAANANDKKGYAESGEYNADKFNKIETRLNDLVERVEKLKAKVQSMNLYNANPAIYNIGTYKIEGNNNFSYDPQGKTYKDLVLGYEAIIKKAQDAIDDAKTKFDNKTSLAHTDALWVIEKNILPENTYLDGILSIIDEFVKEDGIIDQQAEIYADKVPEANFNQLMAYLKDPNTGEGALKKLMDRLDMDYFGLQDKNGWREYDEDGKLTYIVGYDQNGDGKVTEGDVATDEGISLRKLTELGALKAYNGKPLSAEQIKYIDELFTAYSNKYNEALAIYHRNWFTKEEAIAHNSGLEGAAEAGQKVRDNDRFIPNTWLDKPAWITVNDELKVENENSSAWYNSKLDGAVKPGDYTGEIYTQEDANAYNATLPGALSLNDVGTTYRNNYTRQDYSQYWENWGYVDYCNIGNTHQLQDFFDVAGHYPKNTLDNRNPARAYTPLDEKWTNVTGNADPNRPVSAVLTADDINDYNEALEGARHEGYKVTYNATTANAYNETLAGHVLAGEDRLYTQEEADRYNSDPMIQAHIDEVQFVDYQGVDNENNFKPAKELWKKQDYEKANGELGVAIAIINELNDKLQNELEPELMAEAVAQDNFKKIFDIIVPDRNAADGSQVNYQAGYVNFFDLDNFGKWWNGLLRVSKKTIDPDASAIVYQFNDLFDELIEGGKDADEKAIAKAKENMHPNDLALYNKFAGIYQRIIELYKSLDQSYLDRDFSAWDLKAKEDAAAPTWTIDNATLNQIEKDIKAFVKDAVAEQVKVQENFEALFKLMTLSNVDADDNDGEYDFDNLIIAKDLTTTLPSRVLSQIGKVLNQTNTAIAPAGGWDNIDVTDPEQSAYLKAILFTLVGGEFDIRNLLNTTGINAIKENDQKAMADGIVENMLEPTKPGVDVDDNEVIYNLHTFHNQLAAPGQELEPEAFVEKTADGARRAADAEEEKVGGELYEALKDFIADLNLAIDNRTLDEDFAELRKTLRTLTEDILLIDEHAAANNDQHDDMNEAIGNLQEKLDEAQEIINAMDDGTAKTNAQQELDNAQKNFIDGLQATVDKDYEEGHAWQDDVQEAEQKALERAEGIVQLIIDRATGVFGFPMMVDNNNAFRTFEQLYKDATEEHTDLVAKLEQLKNLNANAAAEGGNFKSEVEKLAADINTFLFGNKEADNTDATLTAQDKLDKAFTEGKEAKNAANGARPVQAWAEDDFTGRINEVKDQMESFITQIDNKILEAIAMWDSKNGDIYAAAEYAFKNYNIYKPAYLKVQSMPGNKKTEPTEEEVKAYQEAYQAAVEKIITENGDFNELWNRTNAIDDAIESFTSEDNDKTVGSLTYKRGNFNSLNKLFDQIAWFDLDNAKGNYATALADGKDAEAQADAAMYKEFADAHLAEDAAAIISLGLDLDELIPNATETFAKILEDYDKVVTIQTGDDKGKDFVVTAANHDEYINKIQAIAGSWKGYTTSGNNLTWNWNENGRCAFVHTLVQNNNLENQEANMAALDELQNKLDAAKAYIKGYQVAAEFAAKIQELQDAIDRYKEFAQDEKVILSAFSISKKVQDLVKEFGDITTHDTKKIETYAGADKEFGTADDVFGGMGAEVGKIPAALVNAAWDAEKKALEQDINEMRAAVKLLDQDDAHYTNDVIKAHSDDVEALWTKVEAAKREVKKIETKVKDKPSKWDFEAQVRDDLGAVQAEVLAKYKELRGLTMASQNISGIAANGNGRLAALRANVVEDEYAAGAPNVQKLQAELNALIADAQEVLSAAVADGSADFFRQKIETMLQNAENKLTERDAAAQVWSDRYEYYSKYLTEAAKAVEKSKEAVNKWVDSEKYPTSEAYDLAATQSALYAVAQEKLDDAIELSWAIVDDYKYANGQYVLTEELEDAIEAYVEAIAKAEDACADYDLMNRVKAINKTLDELKNKAANGVYEEGYLEDNQICSKDEDGEITWGWKVNNLESRISKLIGLIESETNLTTTALDGKASDYAYENLRARIEQWQLDNLETEEDETKLVHGIQFRLEELADIIGNNVLGDMNKDGKVTLADVRIIANIALGIEEMPNVGSDEFMRADVNEDGIIDITDASCAVNIYFYGNPEGINYWIPEEARSAENVKEAVNVTATKTAQGLTRLAINLDNAQQFTAFQMDLQLAEGMKLAAASLGERAGKQFLLTNEVDGMLHIGAMSITNGAISGNSGAVLYLDFEVAEGAEENFARFQNVFFVTKNAKKVNFELGGITPTGIQSANAETALGQKFYDLGGRMKSSLKKGVNIVKDAAGNVKKVIVK